MAVSKKQQKFIAEYLQDYNATQAAIRAGYAEKSSRLQGHRLLKNEEVRAEISRALEESAMSAEEAMMRLADQARSSMGDFLDIDEKGTAKLNFKKSHGKLHLIKKFQRVETISENEDGTHTVTRRTNVELYDAQSALTTIAKAHGVFGRGSEDDPVHTVQYTVRS